MYIIRSVTVSFDRMLRDEFENVSFTLLKNTKNPNK